MFLNRFELIGFLGSDAEIEEPIDVCELYGPGESYLSDENAELDAWCDRILASRVDDFADDYCNEIDTADTDAEWIALECLGRG